MLYATLIRKGEYAPHGANTRVKLMNRGAIFDIDGTILDSMPIWENAGIMYLKELGIKADKDLGKKLFSVCMMEGALYLKDKFQLDMSIDEIAEGIVITIEDFYLHKVKLKEGVKQFLGDMKEAGIRMVAATSNERRIIEPALRRLNVIDYFEKIFTCSEIGVGKVKPDIFLACASFMGTEPKDTWVFEDALFAIKTAKKAGFKTVGVYDEFSKDHMDEIKRISDIYFEKLDDFDELCVSLYNKI